MPLLACASAQSDALGSGAATTPPGVTFTVVPAKGSFGPGETVQAALKIENGSTEVVRFQFRTGCQTNFEIGVVDRIVFHSRVHTACTQALTTLELAPGENASRPFSWNRQDDSGVPVPPGVYRVIAFLADGNGPPVSATVELQ
jgi:hypothetical protein